MSRRARMLGAFSVSASVLLGIAWLAWQVGAALPMATGYIAKTMCSETFVAGRRNPEQIWSDIQDVDSLFSWAGYEVDGSARRASGTAIFGLWETTAVYREGLGCTIARGVDPDRLETLTAGTSTTPTALPVAPKTNPNLEAALDWAFSEPSPDSHRMTRAIIVLHRGRIVAERYAPGFDQNTPLIGWSMTKSITNNLIGLLIGDGLLHLDQPAPVPEWQEQDDPRAGITLAQLLQMSSGLDFEEVYAPGSDATNMLFASYSAAESAAAAPLAHEPGTHWYYSSGTSNILARVVRDTLGGSLEKTLTFTRARLLEPLGITSMVIEPDASGALVGSSFSYATARDWARLGQFWLQDGIWNGERLLPEGWLEWSTTPAPAAQKGQYGAQFWLNAGRNGQHRNFPGLPSNMFFAHGFNSQIVAVFPDEELVVVRLGFTTDDSWSDTEFLSGVLAALD